MADSQPTLFDTIHAVQTPEGAHVYADLAGPIPRALAYTVDLGIRLVVLAIGGLFASLIGKAGSEFWVILWFLMEWWYPVFYEMLRKGQTPGKRMYNLVVVNKDLSQLTWNRSIARNLLRLVDFLPSLYLVGLFSLTFTRKFQRLGDLIAGTLVVQGVPRATKDCLPPADGCAPTIAFSSAEQDAIIEFAQRHSYLSPTRQEELSNILTPLTQRQGEEGVTYLRTLGTRFLGSR